MFESLAKVFSIALQLWDDKEKMRYVNKLIDLRKLYALETNRPFGDRNNALIDNTERELRELAELFAAGVGKQDLRH